jgi:hypothetical protein
MPHPRFARNKNRRRGRAGRNTALGNPSAQEMMDGLEKNNTDK